jgi:Antibiotic biosynthesis monooxygenase
VRRTWLKLCKRGWLLARVPLRLPQRYGGAMTHARVWKFRPPAGREDEFHAAYSGSGNWARLFEQAPGYRGTELLRPVEAGGWWLTIDRWDTVAHFEVFQDDFGVQYRGLDEELEGVAGEEVFVGAFEE